MDLKKSILASPVITLVIAALTGLVYVFLVPPWQHNDEPGHFEYAWLAANRESWPQPGDVDEGMRREVAASMIEHGFYREIGGVPNLVSIEPITIGISQLGDGPVYYFLASLPLRLFRYTDITFQLYTARLVSLILFLAIVWLSFHIFKELISDPVLALLPPLLVVFLPGFVDKMTAVNNDVAAVAILSLFMWMSVRIIKKGMNWLDAAGLVVSLVLCLFTKKTAWIALPFGVLSVYLAVFRNHKTWAWAGLAILLAIGLASSFSWSQSAPAYYYSPLNITFPERIESPAAPAGRYAMRVKAGATAFFQTLNRDLVASLAGETITLGAWGWSSDAGYVHFPQLRVNNQELAEPFTIETTRQPGFFAISFEIPEDARTGVLTGWARAASSGVDSYWDCIVLARGDLRENPPPRILDPDCRQFEWAGQVVDNPVKNASAERGWPVLKPTIGERFDSLFHISVTDLWVIIDPDAGPQYIEAVGGHLFRTFWGRFGWGHVPLVGSRPYTLFVIMTIVALLGGILAAWMRRSSINWNVVLFFGLLAGTQFLMALFRAAGNWYNYVFTPTARYYFPAIVPAAFFLCTGWYQIAVVIFRNKLPRITLAGIFLGFLIFLNGWAWYSIWSFYYL